jgi:UPF0271 protein
MRVSDITAVKRVDLNVDLGEGFPFDEQLLDFATSANVCCGVHAGNESLTMRTVALCRAKNVRVGAHPGYPDRESMGRRPIDDEHQRVYLDSVFNQVRRFTQVAKPSYLKPHGAFYNDTAVPIPEGWDVDEDGQRGYQAGGVFLARHPGVQSLAMLLRVYKLPLMGLEGTAHEVVARRTNQRFMREGFADRAYCPDGTLVPRSEPGAVLSDENAIVEQVLRLAPIVDSICLHGDTPNCVEYAQLVRRTLKGAGYEVRP